MCELSAGLLTEVSIPSDMRWIPAKMEIFYLSKAKTSVRGIAKIYFPPFGNSQDIKSAG